MHLENTGFGKFCLARFLPHVHCESARRIPYKPVKAQSSESRGERREGKSEEGRVEETTRERPHGLCRDVGTIVSSD